uniref:DUF7918 domain-containing protein n=1 Tax=Kwoniella pini CBS 10737 TaxID=1296096 RepID=A0A1B9I5M4_9TREE|nr:uncharacterized protein I206_02880 [Kwoniella pini CBS 10737]OCF50823.1 hypothetical protein I206_02880 [Kwoniella pini CBS 10737]
MLALVSEAGFEAWVAKKDSDERLNEYQITHHPAADGQPPYSECFLETIDEPFEIKIAKKLIARGRHLVKRFGKTTHMGHRSECTIDGQRLSHSLWKEKYKDHCWSQILENDEEEGRCYSSCLKFAPLQTTDDPDQVNIDNDRLKNLGLIEITITKGLWVEQGAMRGGRKQKNKLTNAIADERAKKFAYTVNTVDRREVANPYRRPGCDFVPSTALPDYKFVFKVLPSESFFNNSRNYRQVCSFLIGWFYSSLMSSQFIDEPTPPPSPRLARRLTGKRKRSSEAVESIPLKEEIDDIKPHLDRKRVKYLEEQVQMLSSELRTVRSGGRGQSRADPVDLTLDD